MRALLGTLGAALLLTACSSGVSGTYVGGDDSFLGSLTFKGDNKVDVVLINGVGGEGTYEVKGDVVRITANGTTNELTIDGDCLKGQLMVGTLCKGNKPSAPAASGSSSRGGGGLAGSTFETRAEGGGRMAFEFAEGGAVRVRTEAPGGGSGLLDGSYSAIGDQVVITIQGQPETFTLDGNTLRGELDGDQLIFQRK